MRGAIVLLAGLALTGAADAAPPVVTAAAAPAGGVAPVRVTLTATGDAASYAWSLGDGATADGAVVTHVYGAGTFVATVTATNEAGEVAQAQVTWPPAAARCRSRRRAAPATASRPCSPARSGLPCAARACRSTAAGRT